MFDFGNSRFFSSSLRGAKSGLFVGIAASSYMTLTSEELGSPDFSMLCLNEIASTIFFGGLVGFLNSFRRDPREVEADFIDLTANCLFLARAVFDIFVLSGSPATSDRPSSLSHRLPSLSL